MYFSAEDRGEMMSMVYNWPADQVYITFQLPLCRITPFTEQFLQLLIAMRRLLGLQRPWSCI